MNLCQSSNFINNYNGYGQVNHSQWDLYLHSRKWLGLICTSDLWTYNRVNWEFQKYIFLRSNITFTTLINFVCLLYLSWATGIACWVQLEASGYYNHYTNLLNSFSWTDHNAFSVLKRMQNRSLYTMIVMLNNILWPSLVWVEGIP